MDGTLWNASESYARVWNVTLSRYGIAGNITGKDLTGFIGMSIDQILDAGLLGQTRLPVTHDEFLRSLDAVEDEIMPSLGGVPYDGVLTGLKSLSRHYRLFLVSNCSPRGLINFMRFTGTAQCFTDSVSYGQRPVPKSENIMLMTQRHKLNGAVYVGDTQQDCDHAHRAGLPFVFASYGFGTCQDPDMTITTFGDLTSFFCPQQRRQLLTNM